MANEKEKELTDGTVTRPKKKEIKYPLEQFMENAEALGYRREAVAGALYYCKETELSKTEFKKIVDEFLKKEVGK